MSFNLTYGLLFEVTFRHNYFLNNGAETFESMAAADQKKMLQQFDTGYFAGIAPTLETDRLMKNHKMVFKRIKTGFRVYVKVNETDETDPFIPIPASLKLDFSIRISDYQFSNYTNLEFTPNRTFLFANAKPATEPATFKYIPTISENKFVSDGYLVSAPTTADLLKALKAPEKQDLFGIISLTMQGDNDPENIIDDAGRILSPIFKLHFENRKTLWKYINRKTATAIETNAVKPLTYSGFVEIDPLTDFTPPEAASSQYPNPSVKSITKIGSDYYSEIFI